MKKITYKWIDGILLALLIVGGGTYYIQDSGEKSGCRAGWVDVEDIEFEWQWSCTTGSGVRYETCYEVYNSSNTENYWCKKGKLVEIEEQPLQIEYKVPSGEIHCTSKGCI